MCASYSRWPACLCQGISSLWHHWSKRPDCDCGGSQHPADFWLWDWFRSCKHWCCHYHPPFAVSRTITRQRFGSSCDNGSESICMCVRACSSSSRSQRGPLAYLCIYIYIYFYVMMKTALKNSFFPESSKHCWKEVVLEMLRICAFTIKWSLRTLVSHILYIYIYICVYICF